MNNLNRKRRRQTIRRRVLRRVRYQGRIGESKIHNSVPWPRLDVRDALDELQADGLIESEEVGRAAQMWDLTDAARREILCKRLLKKLKGKHMTRQVEK